MSRQRGCSGQRAPFGRRKPIIRAQRLGGWGTARHLWGVQDLGPIQVQLPGWTLTEVEVGERMQGAPGVKPQPDDHSAPTLTIQT